MVTQLLVAAPTPVDQHYAAALRDSGFALTYAGSLAETVRHVVAGAADGVLALVDDGGAPQLCEVLRALGDLPLMVAGHDLSPETAAECLDRGADAAAMLPLSAQELSARLLAVLRRSGSQPASEAPAQITAGSLIIDTDTRQVHWRGRRVDLTPTEFHVLSVLAEKPGRVVTNGELLTRVWGPEYADDVHYVRLYIGYLRGKLEEDPHRPEVIRNQWGVGYRLSIEE